MSEVGDMREAGGQSRLSPKLPAGNTDVIEAVKAV